MRLFLAINLPDEWKKLLRQPQKSIGWLGHGVRWVDPQGIHMTLKFLGDVDEKQLPAINDLLTEVAGNYSTFELVIAGTGVFPTPRRPRVFWAKVKAPDTLAELQKEIEKSLLPIGFPAEDREFQPIVSCPVPRWIRHPDTRVGSGGKHDTQGGLPVIYIFRIQRQLVPAARPPSRAACGCRRR